MNLRDCLNCKILKRIKDAEVTEEVAEMANRVSCQSMIEWLDRHGIEVPLREREYAYGVA